MLAYKLLPPKSKKLIGSSIVLASGQKQKPQAHQKFSDTSKRKVYDQFFQRENQVVLRPQPEVYTPKTTTSKSTQRKEYEEWIKKERAKVEKQSRFRVTKY